MRRRSFGVCAALAVTWVSAALLQADDPIVPVFHEPHHRQVFQYGRRGSSISRFRRATSPGSTRTSRRCSTSRSARRGPGRRIWARSGEAAARRAAARDEGEPPRPRMPMRPAAPHRRDRLPAPVAPGTLISRVSSTTSYVERPITHRLENIGEGLFRAMVVINETAGDEATTQEAAGFSGKPELTNRWFRAYRFALAPGESTPKHRHTAPVAVFQASSGRGGLGIGGMKFEFNDPGQWAFFDAGDAHEIKKPGSARDGVRRGRGPARRNDVLPVVMVLPSTCST